MGNTPSVGEDHDGPDFIIEVDQDVIENIIGEPLPSQAPDGEGEDVYGGGREPQAGATQTPPFVPATEEFLAPPLPTAAGASTTQSAPPQEETPADGTEGSEQSGGSTADTPPPPHQHQHHHHFHHQHSASTDSSTRSGVGSERVVPYPPVVTHSTTHIQIPADAYTRMNKQQRKLRARVQHLEEENEKLHELVKQREEQAYRNGMQAMHKAYTEKKEQLRIRNEQQARKREDHTLGTMKHHTGNLRQRIKTVDVEKAEECQTIRQQVLDCYKSSSDPLHCQELIAAFSSCTLKLKQSFIEQ